MRPTSWDSIHERQVAGSIGSRNPAHTRAGLSPRVASTSHASVFPKRDAR
jgi:hypothetical protein